MKDPLVAFSALFFYALLWDSFPVHCCFYDFLLLLFRSLVRHRHRPFSQPLSFLLGRYLWASVPLFAFFERNPRGPACKTAPLCVLCPLEFPNNAPVSRGSFGFWFCCGFVFAYLFAKFFPCPRFPIEGDLKILTWSNKLPFFS